MPKYKCINKDCRNYNNVVLKDTTIKIDEDNITDTAKRCYYCNLDMMCIPTNGMTTNMTGSNNICKK